MELMVASIIGAVLVMSVFQLYLSQHRSWIIQDEVTDAQQSARASIRMLSDHIRMAGYALPDGMPAIIAWNTDPDTLMVFYQPPGMCDAPLEWDMPQPSAELRCDGHDISCFEENKWAYIYDPAADTGEFFVITEVQEASSHIQHNTTVLSRKYPKGSQVFMVEAYRFYIDQGADPEAATAVPTLMVEKMGEGGPVAFADYIDDLQFRFVMQNGDTLDVPNYANLVRRVFVTVSARTARPEQLDESIDEEIYRHREFATEVQVRNLGF